MTTTLPKCLTRRAADDRWEARDDACAALNRKARRVNKREMPTGAWVQNAAWPEAFDAALAEIQRTQAEAIRDLIPRHWERPEHFALTSLRGVAFRAASYANYVANFYAEKTSLTPAQRATLLDATRMLVSVAIEVAG